MRRPIIGVMGGSKVEEGVYETARQLGRLIAEQGWILLNGGRNTGVMAASAEGAKEGGGLVVGILPDKTTKRGSPHVDIPILTGMGDGRNLINAMSSDVVVACKGALGTLSEVVLGLKCGKRVILLGWSLGQNFQRYERSGQLTMAKSPADAVDQVKEALSEMRE